MKIQADDGADAQLDKRLIGVPIPDSVLSLNGLRMYLRRCQEALLSRDRLSRTVKVPRTRAHCARVSF